MATGRARVQHLGVLWLREFLAEVQLARVDGIHKTPWWQAPFLARWDMQSRLEAWCDVGPALGAFLKGFSTRGSSL